MLYEMWDGYISPTPAEIAEEKRLKNDKIFAHFQNAVTIMAKKPSSSKDHPQSKGQLKP